MLFTTPYIVASVCLSLAYIFLPAPAKNIRPISCRRYPDPAEREELYLVVGETHHPKRPESVETPRWLVIPNRGTLHRHRGLRRDR